MGFYFCYNLRFERSGYFGGLGESFVGDVIQFLFYLLPVQIF